MMPAPIYAPPSQTDSKAVIALVLGIVSILCCGFGMLFGIPAIVLGAMSKRDINRSGGTLGGDGMAIGGMVTGGLSTLISLAYIAVQLVALTTLGAAPPYTATPYTPPATYTTPLTTGAIHATELTKAGGPLKDQVLGEVLSAKAAGERVLVYEYARGAPACTEFDRTLSDFDMQRILKTVRLVRVEAFEFVADLPALAMNKTAYPWFWKLDSKTNASGKDELLIVDSISGDEWGDNYTWNISPVLEAFMNGTYVKTAPDPLIAPPPLKTPPKPKPALGF